MTTQSLVLSHQTTLAVKIIIQDDTGALAFSFSLVTQLFTLFWQVSRFVAATKDELSLLITDLRTALDFTAKVFAIGFNSLAYGLGVTR